MNIKQLNEELAKVLNEGDSERLYYYPVGDLELELPLKCAEELSMSGDARPQVDYWKEQPIVKKQLEALTDKQLNSIREYLDMTDEEFNVLSREDKVDYALWLVGGYIWDEYNEGGYEDEK